MTEYENLITDRLDIADEYFMYRLVEWQLEETSRSSHNAFFPFHFSVCWGYLVQHEVFSKEI